MRRNLFFITCFFCLGIAINRLCQLGVTVWLATAVAAFLINAFFLLCRGKVQPAVLLLFVLLAGAFWQGLSRYPEGLYRDMAGRMAEGEGVILTYPRVGEYNVTFTVGVRNLTCGNRTMAGVEKLLLKVKSDVNYTFLP